MTTDRMNRLRRLYTRLTVLERVDLLLAAQEREDFWETEKLNESCPSADLHPYLSRLLALHFVASLLAVQLLAGELLLVVKFTQPARESGSDDAAADAALEPLLARQLTLWRGFVQWCQDLGHDPRQVLRMAPLGLDERDPAFFILQLMIGYLESCAPDLLSDPDGVQHWRGFFTRAFDTGAPS